MKAREEEETTRHEQSSIKKEERYRVEQWHHHHHLHLLHHSLISVSFSSESTSSSSSWLDKDIFLPSSLSHSHPSVSGTSCPFSLTPSSFLTTCSWAAAMIYSGKVIYSASSCHFFFFLLLWINFVPEQKIPSTPDTHLRKTTRWWGRFVPFTPCFTPFTPDKSLPCKTGQDRNRFHACLPISFPSSFRDRNETSSSFSSRDFVILSLPL